GGERLLNMGAGYIGARGVNGVLGKWGEELRGDFIQLDPSPQAKPQMREIPLRWLTMLSRTGQPWAVTRQVVDFIVQLASTAPDKREAREVIVKLLAHDLTGENTEYMAQYLEHGMAQLDPSVDDLRTWRSWAVAPTVELLAAARRNSSLTAWLAALPTLPSLPENNHSH